MSLIALSIFSRKDFDAVIHGSHMLNTKDWQIHLPKRMKTLKHREYWHKNPQDMLALSKWPRQMSRDGVMTAVTWNCHASLSRIMIVRYVLFTWTLLKERQTIHSPVMSRQMKLDKVQKSAGSGKLLYSA